MRHGSDDTTSWAGNGGEKAKAIADLMRWLDSGDAGRSPCDIARQMEGVVVVLENMAQALADWERSTGALPRVTSTDLLRGSASETLTRTLSLGKSFVIQDAGLLFAEGLSRKERVMRTAALRTLRAGPHVVVVLESTPLSPAARAMASELGWRFAKSQTDAIRVAACGK